MRLTVEAKALLKALGHGQSVVERRNTIPILSNVLLHAQGETLGLSTTDLDMEIVEQVKAAVHTEGLVTVPAALLHDICRKMPAGADIELSYGGDDPRMVVKSGRSRFQLPVLQASDYPQMNAADCTTSFEAPTAMLRSLIDRTRFAISTEETRYYLNGLFLHPMEVNGATYLRSVSTDGHRLALAEAPCEQAKDAPAVIVPRKTVAELRKLLDDAGETVTLRLSKAKVHVDLGFSTLTSKVIDGSFPDYSRVIPRDNANLLQVDVELLSAAVDRVATVSQEKARSMRLTLKQGAIVLGVKNMDAGAAHEEVDADYSGPEFDIGFNARYVLDVCSQLKGETAQFAFSDPASPVLVTDPADPSARFVIMPLRV